MISVGIAAYNEEQSIERVLTSWLKEPIDEIVVISDESTDKTDNIVKSLAKKDKRVRLIQRKKREGKPSAVNVIFKKAKADVLIMTDADVYPIKGLTEKLVKHFKNKKIGMVAGHPILYGVKGMVGYWSQISFDIIHKKRLEDVGLDVTGNLYALRAGIVKQIPKEVMLDDTYVALNVKRAGYDIVYEPEAKVYVKSPGSINDFIVQKTRTRAGWYQVMKDEKIYSNRSIRSGIKLYFPLTIRRLLTPKGIIYLPLFYLFSVIVWINGWWKWKKKKKLLDVWKIAQTTKD